MNKFITKTVCALLLLLAVGMGSANAQAPIEARTVVTVQFQQYATSDIFVMVTWYYMDGSSIDSTTQTQKWFAPPLSPPYGVVVPLPFILQDVAPVDIIQMKVTVGRISTGMVDAIIRVYPGYQPSILFPF